MKRKNKDRWAYCPKDNHRCKRRAHSEDQFSAPKTIYFTLLSSLAAFPEICQQLLSAKDTHLASKSNDKGPSSLPMEVMFDSKNKSIYSQQKKRPNWINLIGKFLKTVADFLYIMCNFSEKEKKNHSSTSLSMWLGAGGDGFKKKCHYRKCWLMERNKAT